MNVLVIEDNGATRMLLRQQLQAFGCQASEAASLEAALQVLGSVPIDCALVDCHLPDGSGPDLFRRLRAIAATTRLIAISASFDDDGPALRAAGADDLWQKPISADALKSLAAGPGVSEPRSVRPAAQQLAAERLDDLREMAELAGRESVTAVIDMFITASKDRLANLDAALSRADVKEIKQICHGWRGIAASLGADALTDAVCRCEQAADAGEVDECRRARKQAGEVFSSTVGELQDFTRSILGAHRRNKL